MSFWYAELRNHHFLRSYWGKFIQGRMEKSSKEDKFIGSLIWFINVFNSSHCCSNIWRGIMKKSCILIGKNPWQWSYCEGCLTFPRIQKTLLMNRSDRERIPSVSGKSSCLHFSFKWASFKGCQWEIDKIASVSLLPTSIQQNNKLWKLLS